ncbi:hypothetical protein HHK36_001162 [Tetracentron sinense]|uniref:DUF7733 domain-containing protein n=1 Tax=Tetracentron sinense TaxID=13715 RepID=A0A834ZTJ3_TETSI|nr:hypothetical protein HHK36_001162 [Tetracentron sinense]
MSGGIGPTHGDISLPKEEHSTSIPKNTRRTSLAFRHFNCLAIIIVLAASGMISIEDFGFVLLSPIYIFIISKVAFPTLAPSKELEPPIFDKNNKLLGIYVSFAAVIGLFLPIGYILEGIYEGDKEGIKAAVPHLFLLCAQVFMEGLTFTNRFSIPIWVFVPVFYNSRRIFTIVDWLRCEIARVDGIGGSTRRLYFGRGIAIANLILWCYNLFGFLLPVFLPRAFKRYYGYKVKSVGKMMRLQKIEEKGKGVSFDGTRKRGEDARVVSLDHSFTELVCRKKKPYCNLYFDLLLESRNSSSGSLSGYLRSESPGC